MIAYLVLCVLALMMLYQLIKVLLFTILWLALMPVRVLLWLL
jgi:hypothetical protein